MPDATTLDTFLRDQAKKLRGADRPPTTLPQWQQRRQRLRAAMLAAMGPMPQKPCPLSPRIVGTLKRQRYRIEKLLLQTRPDVWMTATAYVPEPAAGKRPAVLAVHGHWPMARRDPVVQARCLGLVQLGFFVLAVDAFSAGERHPIVAPRSYHGSLLGGTLWPVGQTLLGLQVYDNRRAVDYLVERPEVDADRLGITGASGGGNQSMYAGALDERLKAVVPVCSVGTYEAYLHAACCLCEVLPGALTFTEEGDVLGLVAPRALLVINATKDVFQFSVGEAKKSVARARAVYELYGKAARVEHATFESPHAYNQAMRERMYGWMTYWLKGEGAGAPIAEPKHELEKPEALACYPGGKRPATFLFPPAFAAREAHSLLAPFRDAKLDHKEAWEARAAAMRAALTEVLGPLPAAGKGARFGNSALSDGVRESALLLTPEEGLQIDVLIRWRTRFGRMPACVLLHPGGKAEALKHPLAAALVAAGWVVYAPDLRGTGAAAPARDAVVGAPDHNSAEHALWVGRPLLGQWVADVRAILDFMADQPGLDARRLTVVGLEQGGVIALVSAALLGDRVRSVACVDVWPSYVTTSAYPAGTRLGLLAPGILKAGDVPHLAGLVAPRPLLLVDGKRQGAKDRDLGGLFAFTRRAYGWMKAEAALTVHTGQTVEQVAALVGK